jgi:hypothetical protein
MSGGSFDYLCFVSSADELAQKREALERMADELAALSYARTAAAETQRLVDALIRIDVRLEAGDKLRDVWKAVEWWRSGDRGEDAVRGAVRALEDAD